MAATVISHGTVTRICTADLWEPCPEHHVVHHEAVVTVVTADEWFAPLPGRQHHLITAMIADAFRRAIS